MALKYFGTDGIRGEYGGSDLNDEIAYRAGAALAKLVKDHHETDTPVLIAGRDTRASGVKLLAALAAGFGSEGGRVESIGVAPTPAIAKVVALGDAVAGCAITASHNPCSDNGLKFFCKDGRKPSESFEKELDDAVGKAVAAQPGSNGQVDVSESEKATQYIGLVRRSFPADLLAGKRIALDCANGALSGVATDVFRALGAEVDSVGCDPDGSNINDGVGSEYPQSLKALYETGRYDMGFAFDGDGDRVIAFDQRGQKIAGEATIGLLALHAKEKGELAANTLVTTAQSNLGLDAALAERGVSVRRVDIGDKFVSRLMVAEGFFVGGEESGHVIVGSFSMTGDGLYAALKIAEASVESNRTLEDLASFYKAFPQEKRAIRVASKPPIEECPNVTEVAAQLESEFGDEGRLLIRYSGTEPKIRLLVEAKTAALAADAIERLEKAVSKDLG